MREPPARAGARRFVYSSSAAAYGFHSDNPVGMTEDWPTRPDRRFFYAEEKAELWPRITAEYKGYAGYQTKTDREIPLVICEPR